MLRIQNMSEKAILMRLIPIFLWGFILNVAVKSMPIKNK